MLLPMKCSLVSLRVLIQCLQSEELFCSPSAFAQYCNQKLLWFPVDLEPRQFNPPSCLYEL
jgi:hypothetical protein